MTQTYALFFDIDGTLVSFKTHEIPQSTIQALTQAKANGSRVYIATGRPPLIITNLAVRPKKFRQVPQERISTPWASMERRSSMEAESPVVSFTPPL